jgi:hypothetical protein
MIEREEEKRTNNHHKKSTHCLRISIFHAEHIALKRARRKRKIS